MAWALAQSLKPASTNTPGAAVQGTFGSNATAGNRILLYTNHYDGGAGGDVSTPTDNQGNTYTQLVQGVISGVAVYADIWTAVAGSTGSLVISVTQPNVSGHLGWTAEEYSGLSAASGTGCRDQSATGTGNNGTASDASSGTTPATTANGQLAVSFVAGGGSAHTWTVSAGGFTKNAAASLDGDFNSEIAVGNKTSANGATESCTWTCGGLTDTDIALVAVIKLAAAGVPSLPPPIILTAPVW